jgi:hypothetical protein
MDTFARCGGTISSWTLGMAVWNRKLKVFWSHHGRLNWQDKPDTFEREDGRAIVNVMTRGSKRYTV